MEASPEAMKRSAILALIMLIVGLIIGIGLGAAASARATTITSYSTITTSILVTVTETRTQLITQATSIPAAITNTVTETREDVEQVCFSRVDDCASILVKLIDSAEKYVHVAVYSFTSDALADALIRAKNRGVDVKVVIEKEQSNIKGSEYNRLVAMGVDVRLDGNPATMHHKFMIIDGKIVATGSYNWSAAAEKENDENLIVVSSPGVAKLYEAEFNRVWSQAS